MKTERFQVITSSTRADYRDLVRGLTKAAWPEFMLHDAVAAENCGEQIAAVDFCVHNFLRAPITIDAVKAANNEYC